MIRAFIFYCGLIFATSTHGSAPPYFNEDIDREYRELLRHMEDMLPETNLPLAYLPSFYPFSLMDVRAVKFANISDHQAFANFNFGVLGGMFLNISREQLTQLPSISICKEQQCKQERIELIEGFVAESKREIDTFRRNTNLYIVQQTALSVYRINNTFYSPTQLITYYPTEHAGFVPSSNYTFSKPSEAPDMLVLADATQVLREHMAKYNVAAITKVNDESLNIIFGGLSDNHWGLVINHTSPLPTPGDYNHIGLEYDIIQEISDTSFYYQTN